MDRRKKLSHSYEEGTSSPINIREDVPCQEDGSGSVKSSCSELVACGLGSVCSLTRQHSKSCSNLEDYKDQKIKREDKKCQDESAALGSNGVHHNILGITDNVLESGLDSSPYTSYFSSIRQNHGKMKYCCIYYITRLTQILSFYIVESFMYSTGPLVREIAKKKLVEPGNVLEKVLKYTIPNIASVTMSILSCVSDCFTRSVFTMGYLTVSLIGEAEQNYKLKLNSYKVNFRGSVKEKHGVALSREPEETYSFWEASGQQTFQFKVGAPKSLGKLNGEVVVLECEVGIVPTTKYRLSLTSDFLNISMRENGTK